MGELRRQRREFDRAYKKYQAKVKADALKPMTIDGSPEKFLGDIKSFQELLNKQIEDYEVTTSSK